MPWFEYVYIILRIRRIRTPARLKLEDFLHLPVERYRNGSSLTLEVQKLRLEEEEEVDEGKGFHATTALGAVCI